MNQSENNSQAIEWAEALFEQLRKKSQGTFVSPMYYQVSLLDQMCIVSALVQNKFRTPTFRTIKVNDPLANSARTSVCLNDHVFQDFGDAGFEVQADTEFGTIIALIGVTDGELYIWKQAGNPKTELDEIPVHIEVAYLSNRVNSFINDDINHWYY